MATPYNSANPITKAVFRAEYNLPQSAAAAIFTISGGKVMIHELIGEVVTTAIQAGANNMKLTSNPTVGADVDLCAVLDIDGDAIGTMYQPTGILTEALVATTSGAGIAQAGDIVVAPGTIELSCSASKTGKVKWSLFYTPLDAGAKIVTA